MATRPRRALLVQPPFPGTGFWDYRVVCRVAGARYPAAPLGLITVAALLPRDWELRLVDMNVGPLDDAALDWADLVLTGGMLPQQPGILDVVARARARGRRVAVGGPDPTSQPALYEAADYLVSGEAEEAMPALLADFAAGVPRGRYAAAERPQLAASPVPRFDLLDFDNYLMIGVQFSRGCPFNCEFCDVIELFGRKPRLKEPAQVLRELEELHRLGYRGHVDFVDDNLIGNRPQARALLAALLAWSGERGHPFYFSTEASINLADDPELLRLMQATDFRYVFVGIESADPEVLRANRKLQNVNRTLADDFAAIYRHGIVVNAGFIIGFDTETRESARAIEATVEEGMIPMAMVGLLSALPNTQLTRRLEREGRLFPGGFTVAAGDADQTTSGLNFETLRPREEILADYRHVIEAIYDDRVYFDRVLRLARALRVRTTHRPGPREAARHALGLLRMVRAIGVTTLRARLFWRNVLLLLFTRPSSLETALNLMAMHLHFGPQARHVAAVATGRIADAGETART